MSEVIQNISSNNNKKSRCKKGTRRNLKTGICEPIRSQAKTKKKGPTEQEEDIHGPDVLVEEEEAENIPGPDVLEEEEVIAAPEVLEEEEIPMEPANKTRRCPKGTRFDKKTGL